MKKIILLLVLIIPLGFGCAAQQDSAQLKPSLTKSNMKITSSAFDHEGDIPSKYTCDGANINPALAISEVPAQAKSLVLISDDPDAPAGTWVHWTVWNIDPGTTEIAENSAPGGVEGVTNFGKPGYGGPCPPSGTHRYYFKLYALDTTLDLPASTDAKGLEAAMQGHVLAETVLMGRYSRI